MRTHDVWWKNELAGAVSYGPALLWDGTSEHRLFDGRWVTREQAHAYATEHGFTFASV